MNTTMLKLMRPAVAATAICFCASAFASAQPPVRPILGPPLAAAHKPPAQPAFRARAAGLALFLRETSRRAEQTRLSPRVRAFARHIRREADQELAFLGVPNVRMGPKWKSELDQLNHLPAQFWKTRYPVDVKRALEEALRLSQNYARHGTNLSTRKVAARWAARIRNDIPRAEQLSRAR